MGDDTGSGTSEDEALARAVQAVYAADPSDFVATRKEWVARLRSEGLRGVAKQVSTLRKPSVSAAAINALVRADDPVVTRLEDVGARMRHAQSTLDAAALSALRDDRDGVLTAWVAAAREHSPAALTSAVEAEVRDTAVAALADPAATEVATSGSLTRALSYSGFGEVDVADAVARTSTGVVLTRIEGGRDADDDDDEAGTEDAAETEPDEDHGDADVDEGRGDEDEDGSDDEEEDAEGGADEDEAKEDEAEEDEAEEDDDDEPRSEAAIATLEMELDEAEKVVAAARAARRKAAQANTEAEQQLSAASAHLEEAERLVEQARGAVEEAEEEQERAAAALEEAEEELRRSRRQRDDARATLEEAEDQ